MKNATIYDVAREAGVSIKTVSRVVNRDPTVKAANRERVLKAAEALNYSPSRSARSLAGARSFVIAAFLDAELTMNHWQSGCASDYVSRLQLGAIRECRAGGYHFTLELIDHDPTRLAREARAVIQALQPDGILLTPPSSDDPLMIALLEAAGIPYARLGSDTTLTGGLQLRLGDRAGGESVTRHLIALGHRRIAAVTGPPGQPSSQERLAGFRTAAADHDLDLPTELIRAGDFTFDTGREAMRSLLTLADPPTAVFAFNDEMALGCIAALDEAGLDCPTDMSVAGFDDSLGARFSRPQLTTVRQPIAEMASEAVRRLIGVDTYAPGALETDETCRLVVKESTAAPSER